MSQRPLYLHQQLALDALTFSFFGRAASVTMVGNTSIGKPGESEETIVEVYMRRTQQLSGGIVAHIHGDDMLVPLQELMVLLEFAIEETPGGAAGWFISEDRRFVLDFKGGEVQAAGKRYRLKPTDAKRIDNQLFVSAKAMSEWLPLNFHANMRALQLQINPREKMPMEERAARAKGSKFGSIHQFRSELPKQETPYALAQIPALEVDLATGFSNARNSSFYSGGTVRGFGDFLYAQRFDTYRVQQNSENYFATLRRKFGWAEVGMIASYNKYDQLSRFDQFDQVSLKDEYRVAMTVSFSTFTDPATLGTLVTSDRIARQGAIRPVAFHDTNQNGVRDPGEPLVENARVLHTGQRDPYYTGDARQPPAVGVGAGGWTDVAVDRTGLPDATLSPANRGRAVLPRPGVVSDVELPVVAKAGIEGRVDLRLGKDLRGLPNVKVQVVRRAAQAAEVVVAEVNTEFDGAFSLADVPVGDYFVRIEPDQARQIGAKGAVEQPITLTAETGVLEGVALKLSRSSWNTDVCASAKADGKC